MIGLNDEFLRISGIVKDKIFVGPKIANIYINSNCNTNCIYCWFHSTLNKYHPKSIIWKWRTIKHVINQLSSLKTNTILLSANGEPWLHPKICEIIRYIKDKNMYLRVTTNLTFSSHAYIVCFSKVDQLCVNLSAANRNSYQKIHSIEKNLFETVVQNLKIFSRMYKQNKKPEVEIRYIICTENINDIPSILELAIKLGIPRIKFTLMDPTKYTKSLMITNDKKNKLKEIIKPLLQKGLPIQSNLKDIYESLNNYSQSIFNFKQCFVGWFRISIELNGDVGFCCQNDKLVFGNIYNGNTIEQMWYNQKAQNLRLRAKYNLGFRKTFWQVCRYCSMAKMNQDINNKIKIYKQCDECVRI
jgi:MoaA/NifB/PqqE/SkfB family radical SAM enzyme